MALAIDSQESGGTAHHNATSPLTWTFTNTAGNLLIVGAIITGSSGTASFGTISYNGVALSQVASVAYSSNNTIVGLFTLPSPATGANTVSVAGSSTGTLVDILGAAISFSGANGTVGNSATASDTSGTSNLATVNIAGTMSGDFIVSIVATGSGVSSAHSPTLLSASANVSVGTAGDNIGFGDQSTNGGAATASFNLTPDFWGIVAAEVFAAASGFPFPGGSNILRIQSNPWR